MSKKTFTEVLRDHRVNFVDKEYMPCPRYCAVPARTFLVNVKEQTVSCSACGFFAKGIRELTQIAPLFSLPIDPIEEIYVGNKDEFCKRESSPLWQKTGKGKVVRVSCHNRTCDFCGFEWRSKILAAYAHNFAGQDVYYATINDSAWEPMKRRLQRGGKDVFWIRIPISKYRVRIFTNLKTKGMILHERAQSLFVNAVFNAASIEGTRLSWSSNWDDYYVSLPVNSDEEQGENADGEKWVRKQYAGTFHGFTQRLIDQGILDKGTDLSAKVIKMDLPQDAYELLLLSAQCSISDPAAEKAFVERGRQVLRNMLAQKSA